MPAKTFTAATLTASDVNAYLMDQAVVTCTTGTRPTGIEGRVIFETDTDTIRVYDGTTWLAIWRASATYTPTLTGMVVGTGGSAANTARFGFSGGLLSVNGNIVFGTSGTTFPGSTITATLPAGFTASSTATLLLSVGTANLRDTAPGTSYEGLVRLQSSTSVRFVAYDASATYLTATATSTTVPFTWAAGDGIYWQATVAGAF